MTEGEKNVIYQTFAGVGREGPPPDAPARPIGHSVDRSRRKWDAMPYRPVKTPPPPKLDDDEKRRRTRPLVPLSHLLGTYFVLPPSSELRRSTKCDCAPSPESSSMILSSASTSAEEKGAEDDGVRRELVVPLRRFGCVCGPCTAGTARPRADGPDWSTVSPNFRLRISASRLPASTEHQEKPIVRSRQQVFLVSLVAEESAKGYPPRREAGGKGIPLSARPAVVSPKGDRCRPAAAKFSGDAPVISQHTDVTVMLAMGRRRWRDCFAPLHAAGERQLRTFDGQDQSLILVGGAGQGLGLVDECDDHAAVLFAAEIGGVGNVLDQGMGLLEVRRLDVQLFCHGSQEAGVGCGAGGRGRV